jgi:hypothetical protein
MVAVVQLVRASDCGSECRGFESHLPPNKKEVLIKGTSFFHIYISPSGSFGILIRLAQYIYRTSY